jgi:hypothetical protein
MLNPKPIIALDGDGVLLDYHLAYQQAWGKAFGNLPKVKDPFAYWPKDRYEVRHLEVAELTYFRGFFDHQFWSSIPPIDNAIGACQMLVDAGYKLVCVTALDHQYQSARFKNLRDHNFPITHVLTTAQTDSEVSPKSAAIKDLGAVAFVDDYLPYFRGISSDTHRALILREPNGSPNQGPELTIVDSVHQDLQHFADNWIQHQCLQDHRTTD